MEVELRRNEERTIFYTVTHAYPPLTTLHTPVLQFQPMTAVVTIYGRRLPPILVTLSRILITHYRKYFTDKILKIPLENVKHTTAELRNMHLKSYVCCISQHCSLLCFENSKYCSFL